MRLQKWALVGVAAMVAVGATGMASAQTGGTAPAPERKPPIVEPDILREALQLSDEWSIETGPGGCAKIWRRVKDGALSTDASADSKVPCVNGLYDGPLEGTSRAFSMGRVLRNNIRWRNEDKPDKDMFFYALMSEGETATVKSVTSRYQGAEIITGNQSVKYPYVQINDANQKTQLKIDSMDWSCDGLKTDFGKASKRFDARAWSMIDTMLDECRKLKGAERDALRLNFIYILKAGDSYMNEKGELLLLKEGPLTYLYPCAKLRTGVTFETADSSICQEKYREYVRGWAPTIEAVLTQSKIEDDWINARADDWRANLGARVEAVKVKRVAAKEEEKRLALQSLIDRQNGWLATLPAKSAPAAKTFTASAGGNNAGVVIFSNKNETAFQFFIDPKELKLPESMLLYTDGYPSLEAQEPTIAGGNSSISAELANLAKSGATTAYVFHLDRGMTFGGPVSFTPRTERVLMSSTVTNNPEYPRLQNELYAAESELSAAQNEYDTEVRRANSVGYGNTAGAIAGIMTAVQKTSRLSNAEQRVASLRQQLANTSPQNTNQQFSNFPTGDVSYRQEADRVLAIYVCDLVAKVCGERERQVKSSVTVNRPVAIIAGETAEAARKSQEQKVMTQLQELDSKMQFGTDIPGLAKYMDGTRMAIPMAQLAGYLDYADKAYAAKNRAPFDALEAQQAAAFTGIANSTAGLRGKFTEIDMMIMRAQNAAADKQAAAEEAARKAKLQKLE